MRKITLEISNQAAAVGLQFLVKKSEFVEVGQWISGDDIYIDGETIEIVGEFCYLGSFISDYCIGDKEIRSRLAEANSTFGHLGKIWATIGLSNTNKLRLRGASAVYMDAERIPRQAMAWMPNGRRNIDGPRMFWLNNVERDLSSIGSYSFS